MTNRLSLSRPDIQSTVAGTAPHPLQSPEIVHILIKPVIFHIIVAHGDLPDQHVAGSRLHREVVVLMRPQGNALSRAQQHARSRRRIVRTAVGIHQNRLIGQTAFPVILVNRDDQISSAPVNDILALFPVKMHRRPLAFLEHNQLLRVNLLVPVIILISISQGNQGKSHLLPVSHAEIRDIPAQHIIPDFIVLMALLFPVLPGPGAERRQHKPMLPCQPLHIADAAVDL